ncbi:MAG: phage tail tape measure protein, partial [Wolinella sp.]
MQDIGVGLSIGIALKGLSSINVCTSSFKKLHKSIALAGESVKHLNKSLAAIKLNNIKIARIEESMGRFKSKAIEKAAFGASAAMPIKVAMDFESAMADVKKVVEFVNNVELKGFEKSILSLSRTIPLSANELASITASGGALGIAKENLLGFTTVVAKMSTAFDMSAEVAGESIAKLMTVYKLGIKEAEALGDSINHLSDNSAAKAKDIVETLGRIGGSAKVFGLSAAEAGALSSAFIALGKTPEVAATGINALLNKLATAPEQGAKFQEALQSIGVDASYLKTAIQNNPQKALEQFLGALEVIDNSEKMGVLTKLFGAEYSDDLSLLVGGLDEYRKALKLVNDENKNGSMQREFENRSATTANSLQLMKNSLAEVGVNFGSLFLPFLSTTLKALSSFSSKIADFISSFPTLSKVIGSVLFGLVAFSVVLPAVGFVVSALSANILALKNAYHYLKIAMTLSAKWFKGLLGLKIIDIKIGLKLYAQTLRNSIALKLQAISAWLVGARLRATILLTTAYSAATKLATFTSLAFSKALNFLKIGFLTSAGALKVLKIALISTGIGALVVALGMAAAYVIENWDKVKEFFTSL